MANQDDGQKHKTAACEPECDCGATGVGSRTKWIICGVVTLAAIATVATHVSRTRAANSQAIPRDYEAMISSVASVDVAEPSAGADCCTRLKAMGELNQAATNTEAVFIILPSSDEDRMTAIRKEVTSAVTTIATDGTKVGTLILSKDAPEYAGLARQVGTPAILVMRKGLGMSVVQNQEVTQGNLLKAFVAASRPSSCGRSACAPGDGGCN